MVWYAKTKIKQISRKALYFDCLPMPMSQSSRLNEVLHWCCPREVSQWLEGTKPPQTRDTAVTRRYGWPLTAQREKLDKVDVIFIYCMGNNVLCSIHTASSEFSSTAGLMWNLKCLWLLSRSKCSYFFKLILRSCCTEAETRGLAKFLRTGAKLCTNFLVHVISSIECGEQFSIYKWKKS